MVMRKNIFLVIWVLFCGGLFAQNATVKGVIVEEETGQAIPHASVILDGISGMSSDFGGTFFFKGLSTGTFNLEIELLGYEKKAIVFEVREQNQMVDLANIKLAISDMRIDEVVIVSSPNHYSQKYQGSNFVLSAKEIEQIKPIGTEELLKRVAGVNVAGDMGISNRLNVGIRGSYPRRSSGILVMEDGTPIAPAPYLAPEAYYNPPSDRLDGIEILKGADILAYGSNTMYGAINYITKKPPVKPTLGINLTGGGNGYHSEYLTYGGTWKNYGAEVQVLNKAFGGFQDNSQSAIFNTSAKFYTELNEQASLYVKLNYHQEKSKASYSSLTPFSFGINPGLNPFDADDLQTKRYAVDVIHHYKLTEKLMIQSKLYGSMFQRDWWRQENTLIKASTASTYLGQTIYNQHYGYLEGKTFGEEDYIRVGKVAAGRESTRARNRVFGVGGIQETLKYDWEKGDFSMNLEASVKAHFETFSNIEMKNDSSRFARSGTIDKDLYYTLGAYSGYITDKISFRKITVAPSLRYEIVEMYGFDKIAISKMPDNDGSRYFGSQRNQFSSLLPGLTANVALLDNDKNTLSAFGGIYKGYTAPIAEFGFFNVSDDVVSTPTTEKPINRTPETSNNFEAGIRGDLLRSVANVQLVYFNNRISNYYSAGRNEAFQTLGAVNINGIESSLYLNLNRLFPMKNHELTLNLSGTWMHGKVLSGLLKDSDLLKAKHTADTKAELIEKINEERNGYSVYFASSTGADSLVSGDLAIADFSKIKRVDFVFGENGIAKNTVPYVPALLFNAGLSYTFKGLNIGVNYNYVAKQYTDYLNFEHETAEGAIGSLPAFSTLDANLNYSFGQSSQKYLKGLTVFVAGKNLTNEIYMASRLHRVSSGIMPGGFRQMNVGLKYEF